MSNRYECLDLRSRAVCFLKCANVVIPDGYEHVSGEWNNGFVIRKKETGDEYCWVPVEVLDADGFIHGNYHCKVCFDRKFGRRYYEQKSYANRIIGPSSRGKYLEKFEGDLMEQERAIERNGGFWISRYHISLGSDKKPHSVKGKMPWVNISYEKAKEVAASMEKGEKLKSHILYGAEYDSLCSWIIKSKAKTLDEVINDSSSWGNYCKDICKLPELKVTGSTDEYETVGFYDVSGNVREWTQEKYVYTMEENFEHFVKHRQIARGGSYNFGSNEGIMTAFCRSPVSASEECDDIGFRVALLDLS